MKYYEVLPSRNACRRLTNFSYSTYLKNIKTEFCLSQNLEDFPNFNIEYSPLLIDEPPYSDLLNDEVNQGYGFTISEKAQKCIESLNLGKHKFYKIGNALDDETRIRLDVIYYRLQIIKIIPNYLSQIDFINSLWVTKKYPADNEIEIKINTYEQYKEFQLSYTNKIYFKKLRFFKEFENPFPDLFKFHEIFSGYFYYKTLICSENFKQVVENNQLTGFEFNEIEIEFEDEIL